MFKHYFLRNTDLGTGWFVGAVCGVLVFLAISALLAYYGFSTIGFVLGILAGLPTVQIVYDKGLFQVPARHRALATWNGKRMDDAETETGEGWKWRFWFLDLVGFVAHSLEPQVLLLENIPTETENETQIPVTLAITYHTYPGELFHYDQVKKELTKLITNQASEAARAYAITREDVNEFTESAGEMASTVMQYLQHIADGSNRRIGYSRCPVDGDPTQTKKVIDLSQEDRKCPQWGVHFDLVAVKNYEIPHTIAAVSADIDAAGRINAALLANTDQHIAKGIDPTAAAALAYSTVRPDAKNPITVLSLPGIDINRIADVVAGAISSRTTKRR